jgi:hypothetical protein
MKADPCGEKIDHPEDWHSHNKEGKNYRNFRTDAITAMARPAMVRSTGREAGLGAGVIGARAAETVLVASTFTAVVTV